MKKIKFLTWRGMYYTLLFIFNAGIVFFSILYDQILLSAGGILLSLFQCRLYSSLSRKSNLLAMERYEQPLHIAVSFYHRPTGLDLKTFKEIYPEKQMQVENPFVPSAN